MSLEPVIGSRFIKYPARRTGDGALVPLFPSLWNQFCGYGEPDVHDDGPDSLHMAWEWWKRLEAVAGPPVVFTRVDRGSVVGETDEDRTEREHDDYMDKLIRNM